MSTNKTENYQLHKWEPGDDFLRAEFNENFAKLDGALADKPEVVAGTVTGTGSFMTIELGFQPKAVIYESRDGSRYNGNGGLSVPGSPVYSSGDTISVTETGFTVSGSYGVLEGRIYNYIAIR